MPNIGTVLKQEISRLSRKESRSQIDPTKKTTAQHRLDIATLKRQVAQLERQVTLLSHQAFAAQPSGSVRNRLWEARGRQCPVDLQLGTRIGAPASRAADQAGRASWDR